MDDLQSTRILKEVVPGDGGAPCTAVRTFRAEGPGFGFAASNGLHVLAVIHCVRPMRLEEP